MTTHSTNTAPKDSQPSSREAQLQTRIDELEQENRELRANLADRHRDATEEMWP